MQRGILVFAISVIMTTTPAYAAQKGPKAVHQPKTRTVSTSTVKVHATPAGKTHAKANVKTARANTTRTKTTTRTRTKTTTATSPTTAPAPTASPTTSPTGTLSPVQQKLLRNPNLSAKLQSRLPAGTDLMAASAGFRNLGQFVATVNTSYNHGLSFIALKRRIVGQGMSLGQATQDLR